MNGLTQLASVPDHPVWTELERCFRARLNQADRQHIVHVVQTVLSERPDVDLNELVLQVTESVLAKRRQGR